MLTFAEIKGGETYNSDFIKNLKKFPTTQLEPKIEKILIYTGERPFKIEDIRIIPFIEFVRFLKELNEYSY